MAYSELIKSFHRIRPLMHDSAQECRFSKGRRKTADSNQYSAYSRG